NYSNELRDLQTALPLLQSSLGWYRRLAKLTATTYLYANSMQTQQRKIPMRGVNGTFKTWTEMLPVYEKELSNFKKNLDSLQSADVKRETGVDSPNAAAHVSRLTSADSR